MTATAPEGPELCLPCRVSPPARVGTNSTGITGTRVRPLKRGGPRIGGVSVTGTPVQMGGRDSQGARMARIGLACLAGRPLCKRPGRPEASGPAQKLAGWAEAA